MVIFLKLGSHIDRNTIWSLECILCLQNLIVRYLKNQIIGIAHCLGIVESN